MQHSKEIYNFHIKYETCIQNIQNEYFYAKCTFYMQIVMENAKYAKYAKYTFFTSRNCIKRKKMPTCKTSPSGPDHALRAPRSKFSCAPQRESSWHFLVGRGVFLGFVYISNIMVTYGNFFFHK